MSLIWFDRLSTGGINVPDIMAAEVRLWVTDIRGSSMSGRQSAIRRAKRPDNGSLPRPVDAPVCKPYLSISELGYTNAVDWSGDPQTMVSRGVLREGEHFFHVGRRPVFKWAAIVDFIEQGPPHERVPHHRE
jgi:hypothetical protein